MIKDLPHCTKCEIIGYINDKYCSNCGSELVTNSKNLFICKKCNEVILHPINYYCSKCGGELKSEFKVDTDNKL